MTIKRWTQGEIESEGDRVLGDFVAASDYDALVARLMEAERLLSMYRFCGDAYPRGGWPDINEFLDITTDSAPAVHEHEWTDHAYCLICGVRYDSAPAAPEPTLVVANYGTEIYRGPQSGWGQFKLQPGVLYNLTAQLIERPDSAPVIVGVDLASGPDVTGYMCAKHGALDEPHCYQCDYESL